jgi:carboxyl-terminal processing protease
LNPYEDNNYDNQSPYSQPSGPNDYPAQPPKRNGGGFWLGLLLGVIITCLIGSGTFVGLRVAQLVKANRAQQASADAGGAESVINDESIAKVEAIEEVIDKYYYKDEDIDKDAMIEGMYSGIVASLGDPYSVYYTAEEWESLMEDTEGIYYGIGAYLSLDEATGLAKISGVIADTPAEEAGLRENDIIYQVDGESIQGLELSEIVTKVKGKEGTTVHLTIIRDGETDYLELDVERRQIETPTVTYEMYDNEIGYIQIKEFDEVTTDQFIEALDAVKAADAKGLILDLRGNPGGSLPVVVEIARNILPEGRIVYTEDKYGEQEEYTCDGKNELQIPLVVLVNGNSASASEILAGAIKDYNKGTLIGTTTFGKGIVQRVLPLTDGTAMKLTISAYYTPNGNNIHGIGIEPDIECELDTEAYYEEGIDNQLERALEEVKSMIK